MQVRDDDVSHRSPNRIVIGIQGVDRKVLTMEVQREFHLLCRLRPGELAGRYRPAWSSTGRELRFVRGLRGRSPPVKADLVSVGIDPGTPPGVGKEQVLSSESRGIDYWGATPDGQRFAIVRGSRNESRYSGLKVVIVENWFEELKAAAGR